MGGDLGAPMLDTLATGDSKIEPYSSTVDEESSAARRCRSCSLTLDSEYTELALPLRGRRRGPESAGLYSWPLSLGTGVLEPVLDGAVRNDALEITEP